MELKMCSIDPSFCSLYIYFRWRSGEEGRGGPTAMKPHVSAHHGFYVTQQHVNRHKLIYFMNLYIYTVLFLFLKQQFSALNRFSVQFWSTFKPTDTKCCETWSSALQHEMNSCCFVSPSDLRGCTPLCWIIIWPLTPAAWTITQICICDIWNRPCTKYTQVCTKVQVNVF